MIAGVHSIQTRRFAVWDPMQRKLRLGRIVWQRGEWGQKYPDGRCKPYSFKLTFALRPKAFSFYRDSDEISITLLGLAIGYHSSCGGRFV